ncbi:hypothetical protein EAE89_05810 [Photorhabdus heterorhabditis]|nr:hypothetical protein [Photorhabdus heterorhabditis]
MFSRLKTRWKSAHFHVGANFEPLSHPLQTSVRFLHHPLPAFPSVNLTISLARGRKFRLTKFCAIHK